MRGHIEAFTQYLAGHRSARTARNYAAILQSFIDAIGIPPRAWPPLRSDIEAFLARPRRDGRRRSIAGRNQELAALRAFAKFALREFTAQLDPTDGIPFLRESPRDPAVLSAAEVRGLFTAAARNPAPTARACDLAMVAVLSQCGLRVHELVGLDLGQVDVQSATLVAVHGKGGTIHDVPLNAPALALVQAWVAERAAQAAAGERALFVSSRGTRVSIRSVQRFVERLRAAVGTKKKVTPHTFRHSAATLALTFGSDLSTVADLLRHTDLNTTRRYLHLVDVRRREAVRRLGAAVPEAVVPPMAEPDAPGGTPEDGKEPLDAQCDLGDTSAHLARSDLPPAARSHSMQSADSLTDARPSRDARFVSRLVDRDSKTKPRQRHGPGPGGARNETLRICRRRCSRVG